MSKYFIKVYLQFLHRHNHVINFHCSLQDHQVPAQISLVTFSSCSKCSSCLWAFLGQLCHESKRDACCCLSRTSSWLFQNEAAITARDRQCSAPGLCVPEQHIPPCTAARRLTLLARQRPEVGCDLEQTIWHELCSPCSLLTLNKSVQPKCWT